MICISRRHADLDLHSYKKFGAEAHDVTDDSAAVEIETAGTSAVGIEVDITDQYRRFLPWSLGVV